MGGTPAHPPPTFTNCPICSRPCVSPQDLANHVLEAHAEPGKGTSPAPSAPPPQPEPQPQSSDFSRQYPQYESYMASSSTAPSSSSAQAPAMYTNSTTTVDNSSSSSSSSYYGYTPYSADAGRNTSVGSFSSQQPPAYEEINRPGNL
eukprot:GCRY01003773.1.p1 GENE.GCRY01003773.1~~GCRY01003773.1.p1  ORF type:complete len:147 (-),score=26.92 GCRY01003773.1:214-654(-)